MTAEYHSQSQSHFTTGGLPPICSSWRQAPWDLRPDFSFQINTCGHSPYVTSSLERMCLSFTIAAGPRQRIHSQVRVPQESWPHFTVSDSRLHCRMTELTSRRPIIDHHLKRFLCYSVSSVATVTYLPNFCPEMDYSSLLSRTRVLADRCPAMDYSSLLSRTRVLADRCPAMDYSSLLSRTRVLAGRCSAMDYSGFQDSCHNMI
jgi:hypothetical protein